MPEANDKLKVTDPFGAAEADERLSELAAAKQPEAVSPNPRRMEATRKT